VLAKQKDVDKNLDNDVDGGSGEATTSHEQNSVSSTLAGDSQEWKEDGVECEEDDGNHHEFEIIDEVVADEDDLDDQGGEGQDSDDSLDDTELYAMLEEGINKDSIAARPIEREKVVLVGMYSRAIWLGMYSESNEK
jgi:hypothetical protein